MVTDKQLHAAMDAFYPGENWRTRLGDALASSLAEMRAAIEAATTPPSQRVLNHAASVTLAGQAFRLSGKHALAEGCFSTASFLRESLNLSLGFETPRMFVLSTSHITRQTAELFDLKIEGTLSTHERMALPQVYAKGEHGYLLPLIDEPEDRARYEARIDLASIRDLAQALDCRWIMLDQAADTVDGLETYDW